MVEDEAAALRSSGQAIRVAAAATAGRQVALLWNARFRDRSSRIPFVLIFGFSVIFIVTMTALGEVRFAVAWAATGGWAWSVASWAGVRSWRALGSGSASVSIEPGAFEILMPTSRTWYPVAHLARLGVGGDGLELFIRGRGSAVFDLASIDATSRSAIKRLLAMEPDRPDVSAGTVIAEFPNTATALRALGRVTRQLEPRVRSTQRLNVALLGAEMVAFVAILAFWHLILGHRRDARFVTTLADLRSSLVFAVGATVVVVVVPAVVGLALRAAQGSVSTTVRIDGSTISFAQDDGIVVRFAVSALARARVDLDQVVFVTEWPTSVGRVPNDGFFEGGRERLIELLAPITA